MKLHFKAESLKVCTSLCHKTVEYVKTEGVIETGRKAGHKAAQGAYRIRAKSYTLSLDVYDKLSEKSDVLGTTIEFLGEQVFEHGFLRF